MKNNKAFNTLLAAVEKAKNGTPANKNENFWRCEQDRVGNGFATIRFLPAKSDDDVPFVKVFSHGFQGPTGKWFIEECPTTIGQDCFVCQENSPLWATGAEKDKEIVRKRKRKTAYITNILVVSDPKNPDNDGKVFLFKFGQKIFDKIKDKIQPTFADETPTNPFDADEGANFKLKIRKVEGYANYDKSDWESPSAIDFESIKDSLNDLNEFVAPSNFKSFDEMKVKFNKVWNSVDGVPVNSARNDENADVQFAKDAASSAKKQSEASTQTENKDDDGDEMDFFRKLAESDD